MKIQLKQLAILILLLFMITGCSTYSVNQCRAFDWEQKGQSAALSGQTLITGFNYYDKTCFDDNLINVDPQSFEQGYKKGISKYCSKEFGHAFGASGAKYNDICPTEKEAEFMEGYLKGISKFNREKINVSDEKVQNIEYERQDLTTKLDSIKL